MERDAVISAGGAAFLQERLYKMSDPYKILICPKCGNTTSNSEICKCGNDQLENVRIPYASHLLLNNLLQAMCIKTKITPSS